MLHFTTCIKTLNINTMKDADKKLATTWRDELLFSVAQKMLWNLYGTRQWRPSFSELFDLPNYTKIFHICTQLTFSKKFRSMAPKRILISGFSLKIVSFLRWWYLYMVKPQKRFSIEMIQYKGKNCYTRSFIELSCHWFYRVCRKTQTIYLHRSEHLNFPWHPLPHSNNTH